MKYLVEYKSYRPELDEEEILFKHNNPKSSSSDNVIEAKNSIEAIQKLLKYLNSSWNNLKQEETNLVSATLGHLGDKVVYWRVVLSKTQLEKPTIK
jgi:hypothetical protein